MTKQVNLYEAKTHLSQLVDDAARGEEIVIAKNGKPMAKLSAAAAGKPAKRVGGQWAKFMTPEELAYHASGQFEIDSKKWDEEIMHDFKVLQEEPREYDSKWRATSSTRTPSSNSRKRRKRSAAKHAKR
jgi:prevent-host-death family protein